MKLVVEIDGDLDRLMRAEARAGERAVTSAVNAAGGTLKLQWRQQIIGGGLGQRLANAVRSETFPKAQKSLNAAALVYSQAPKLHAAHDAGPIIRARDGFWLAIPFPAAGLGRFQRKLTPAQWEQKTGLKLQMVLRRGKNPLLVTSGRLSQGKRTAGQAKRRGGKRRKDGILTGETSIPIFTLVPQVKLPKRLNLFPAAERIAGTIPGAIVANWRSAT